MHEISFLLKKSINISLIQCKTSLSLCGGQLKKVEAT